MKEDAFQKRLRAATVAGWWTMLVAVIFNIVQWSLFMCVLYTKPDWVLSVFGPHASWEFIQHMLMWFIGAFKLATWIMLMIVICSTIFSRQLSKV